MGSPLKRGALPGSVFLVLSAVLSVECGGVDPKAAFEVQNLEGYWVLDKEKSPTNYITPTIRFELKNRSPAAVRDIEATATFRRKGEQSEWGDAFVTIANRTKPLGAGETASVEMRSSGDYYTPGAPVAPEIMFQHPLFRDATVDLFLRSGRSGFIKMGTLDLPRRLNRTPPS